MARGNGLVDLLIIGAVGAGVYKFSLDGALGSAMQQVAVAIAKSVTGEAPIVQWQSCGGPFGEIVPMITANSQFAGLIQNWQGQRTAAGQNPFDWREFRLYLTLNGFPDPGARPPSVFCRQTP